MIREANTASDGGGAGARGPPPPSAAILGRVIDALGMPQRLPFTGRGRRRSTDEVRGVDELTGGNVPLSVGERGIDDDPSGDEERRGDGRRRSVEELRDIDDLSLDEFRQLEAEGVEERTDNVDSTTHEEPEPGSSSTPQAVAARRIQSEVRAQKARRLRVALRYEQLRREQRETHPPNATSGQL